MAVSICILETDALGKEIASHGNQFFPIAIYEDNIDIEPVPWHWHDEFEIGWITEGSVEIGADQTHFHLTEGEGFFINSGILHDAELQPKGNGTLKSLVFSHRLVSESEESIYFTKYLRPLMENEALPSLKLEKEKHGKLLALIREAWELCRREEFGYELKTRNVISELLLLLSQQENGEECTSGDRRKSLRIKDMLSYIKLHYHENIALSDIASAAGISESEALREFRLYLNDTPIHYLNSHRIHTAAQLLTGTDLSVGEICTGCGFADVSYFTRTFRMEKGLPPAKYRKQFRKTANAEALEIDR